FQVLRQRRPDEASSWEVPRSSTLAIGGALSARSNLLRISAACLVAKFPSAELLPALRSALEDEVWTVRWNAVAAIAALAPDQGLIQVLLRARPRDLSSDVAHDFRRALQVLRDQGLPLPQELSALLRPVDQR